MKIDYIKEETGKKNRTNESKRVAKVPWVYVQKRKWMGGKLTRS